MQTKVLNSKIDDFNKSLKSMNYDTLPQQIITFDLLGKRRFLLNFLVTKNLLEILLKNYSVFHIRDILILA